MLLLLRLLKERCRTKSAASSTIEEGLLNLSGRAPVRPISTEVLLELGAALVALLAVVLGVAFLYLYCLPFLLRRWKSLKTS